MDYKDVKEIKLANPYVGYFPEYVEFAANGFVDMGTSTGGTLRHQLTLNEGEEGQYRISVRYTSSTKAGRIRATVNGTATQLDIEKTDVNDWRKATFTATLKSGKNNLLLTNSGGQPMFIDQIIYTPGDVEPEKYQIFVRKATNGAVEALTGEAAEGETVTFNVVPDEGYELKELRVINGVYYTMAKTISIESFDEQTSTLTFVMPDDQVVLQPVFQKSTKPSGVRVINAEGTESTVIYGIGGDRRQSLQHGVNIIRTADGKARKVMVE